jgi:hypothetical protein
MIDHSKFQVLVKELYATVAELERMFPGRHFTPDGHMVGSLGECLVADAYGLMLETASNKGFDAIAADGTEVEVKATQGKTVAFRSKPQHVIVIKILPDGSFEEVFNGPGALVWEQFRGKVLPSNGQHQIGLSRLRTLNGSVTPADRLSKVR